MRGILAVLSVLAPAVLAAQQVDPSECGKALDGRSHALEASERSLALRSNAYAPDGGTFVSSTRILAPPASMYMDQEGRVYYLNVGTPSMIEAGVLASQQHAVQELRARCAKKTERGKRARSVPRVVWKSHSPVRIRSAAGPRADSQQAD